MNTTTVIFADPDLARRAQQKARVLGLTLSAYVSRLVEKDTHPARQPIVVFPVEHGWGPVPMHVVKRWDEEERQFEEESKRGSHRPGVKGAKSVKELIGLLDQESHLLTHGQDN